MKTLSVLSAKEKLTNLETAKDLYRHLFDGWMIWTIIRLTIFFHMIEPFRFGRPKAQIIQKWLKRLVFALGDLPSFLFPPHKEVMAKSASTMRRVKENGLYKDYFLDDYLLQRPDSFFKLEVLNNEQFFSHSQKPLLKSQMTTTLLDLLTYAAAMLFPPKGAKQAAADIFEDVREEISDWITRGEIERMLAMFYWEKRFYAYLIRRISPRCVLLTNYFDHALIAAAKEAGVRVVEFQHGRVDSFHEITQTASVRQNPVRRLAADRQFLFGEYWKKELEKTGSHDSELRVVGNTMMDYYRAHKTGYRERKSPLVCMLLLTTDFYRQELVDLVVAFMKLAKDRLHVHLNLKLHPSYDQDKTKYLTAFDGDPRLSVYLGNEEPSTGELICMADFHLSVNSTCHYEALGLCVPTIVLGVANHEIALHIVENGHGFLAKTPQDLFDIVKNNWKQFTVPEEVGEWYYRSSALERINQELQFA